MSKEEKNSGIWKGLCPYRAGEKGLPWRSPHLQAVCDERLGGATSPELREVWEEIALNHVSPGCQVASERASASLATLPHGLGPWLAVAHQGLWLAYEEVLFAMGDFVNIAEHAIMGEAIRPRDLWAKDRQDFEVIASMALEHAVGLGRDLALSCGDVDLARALSERRVRLVCPDVLALEMTCWCEELKKLGAEVESMLAEEASTLAALVARLADFEAGE